MQSRKQSVLTGVSLFLTSQTQNWTSYGLQKLSQDWQLITKVN